MTSKNRRSQENVKSRGSHHKGVGRWLSVALPALAVLLMGFGGIHLWGRQGNKDSTTTEVQLAPVSQLPERVRRAPQDVQEACQFAIANPDVLSKIPCYCQCGDIGHKSDLDCFIQRFNSDGSAIFDYHAFG